jgi:uncharacterized Zn finger protein (UPF0148 family)
MDCTHPVLYHKGGALVCHICGAVIGEKEKAEPQKGRKKKPKEAENHAGS